MRIRGDTTRALEILKGMRESLGEGENRSFRNAVDKLITAFENPLFASLLDVQEYYESLLGVDSNYSKLSGSGSKTSQFASSSHVDGSTVSPARTASSDRRSSDEPTLVQPEWEYLEVILKRDADTLGGFGFSIAGGIDAPLSDMDSGIYVTRINANGVADLDGRLRVDDQILAVNGISLEHVTNAEAVQTLRRGGNSLHLVVRRYLGNPTGVASSHSATTPKSTRPTSSTVRTPEVLSESEDYRGEDPVWFEVELRKPNATSGLGFSISGGRSEDDDQIAESGIYITRVNPDGLAYQDGRIMPGDQLMQVNGIDMSQLSHAEAVQVLRNAGQVVHLLLARYPQSTESEGGRSLESGSSTRYR